MLAATPVSKVAFCHLGRPMRRSRTVSVEVFFEVTDAGEKVWLPAGVFQMVVLRECDLGFYVNSLNAARAASSVRSISSGPWAALMKVASNWDGAKYTPLSSMARKKAA